MIVILPFEEKHTPALSILMMEMVDFYGAKVAESMDIEANVLEQTKTMDVLLAFADDALVGFATFKTLFPVGGLLSFTHIQQIYVASSARRLGIARHLMTGIAKTAQNRGCRWIEWATSASNAAARAFYDGLGAASSPKVHYILKDEALNKLAQE